MAPKINSFPFGRLKHSMPPQISRKPSCLSQGQAITMSTKWVDRSICEGFKPLQILYPCHNCLTSASNNQVQVAKLMPQIATRDLQTSAFFNHSFLFLLVSQNDLIDSCAVALFLMTMDRRCCINRGYGWGSVMVGLNRQTQTSPHETAVPHP
jgi:hypothetical protein